MALNVYSMCGSWPLLAEMPPLSLSWQDVMNEMMSSLGILEKCVRNYKTFCSKYCNFFLDKQSPQGLEMLNE